MEPADTADAIVLRNKDREILSLKNEKQQMQMTIDSLRAQLSQSMNAARTDTDTEKQNITLTIQNQMLEKQLEEFKESKQRLEQELYETRQKLEQECKQATAQFINVEKLNVEINCKYLGLKTENDKK